MSQNGADIRRAILFHLGNQHLFHETLFVKLGRRKGSTAETSSKNNGGICLCHRIGGDPKMSRAPKYGLAPAPGARAKRDEDKQDYEETPQPAYPTILPLGYRTGLR